MNRPISVLCVTDYFLPGFWGGGPITTLVNMRKQLKGVLNISVFTRDRDLGSVTKYANVDQNRWNETEDGPIYYACPHTFGPSGLLHAVNSNEFDIIYFNSFFSPKGSVLLYLRLRTICPNSKILLAPRGEFSPGAIALKRYKKKIFIFVARVLGLYREIYWHASTEDECADIARIFPLAKERIFVAADPIKSDIPSIESLRKLKLTGSLRLAFISRISPMKNLDGLIHILRTVENPVELDIYGPIEDEGYWRLCATAIMNLPENVQVEVHGPIAPELVSTTFAKYDLFAFPTHGENFGHVIFEALSAGVPVLLSDQTPWATDNSNAITIMPLHDIHGWKMAIEEAANRTDEEQLRVGLDAQGYAKRYMADEGSYKANLSMFTNVLKP